MRKSIRHRERAGQPAPGAPPAALAAVAAPAPLSFARDIRPMFEPFAAAMMWRFDLTDYTAVMANAQTIANRIASTGNPMPPPPYPMLTAAQIARFQDWINQGCKP